MGSVGVTDLDLGSPVVLGVARVTLDSVTSGLEERDLVSSASVLALLAEDKAKYRG